MFGRTIVASRSTRGRSVAAGTAILVASLGLAAGAAGGNASNQPFVSPPVRASSFDGDLSKVPVVGSRAFPRPEGKVPGAPNAAATPAQERGERSARAPGDGASTDASAPLISFAGMQMTGGAPPDPTGEIGPNNFVEATNARFQIFDRAGTSLAGPSNINTIWAGAGGQCQARNDGDPIVLYDQFADRFIIAQFAVPDPPYAMCIAVSKTGDPVAGGWWRYEYAMPVFPDYEKFGIWRDGLYMSTFEGSNLGVFSFDLAAMRAGTAGTFIRFTTPSSDQVRGSRLLPADIDGEALNPAGAPSIFMQSIDADLTASPTDVDRLELFEFHRDPVPASSTFTKVATLPTAPFDNSLCFGTATPPTYRDCIPQLGTTNKVDPLANRLMWKADYRNFGDHESIVVNQTTDVGGADLAGVRWYELRRTGSGPWSIYQQGTYSPNGTTHRWMGSMAINRLSEIGLGYTVSSTTINPGLRYTGRVASDALGQLGPEQTLVNGSDSDTSGFHRWGDYSQMSVDPVDDCTMWYVGEYGNRRTRIGSFRVSDCVPNTSIAGPSGTISDPTPSFALSGDEAGVTFQCSLDGGAFAGCPASYTTPSLTDGAHTVAARAIGVKGAVDPSPATAAFTVDTTPPPPPPPPTDTTVDGARVKAKKSQRQKGKKVVIKLKAGAAEAVAVRATGKVKVGKKKKSFRLKAASKNVQAGRLAKLKLKPKQRSARRKIAKAKGAKAKIKVLFADGAGNTANKRVSIKLP